MPLANPSDAVTSWCLVRETWNKKGTCVIPHLQRAKRQPSPRPNVGEGYAHVDEMASTDRVAWSCAHRSAGASQRCPLMQTPRIAAGLPYWSGIAMPMDCICCCWWMLFRFDKGVPSAVRYFNRSETDCVSMLCHNGATVPRIWEKWQVTLHLDLHRWILGDAVFDVVQE